MASLQNKTKFDTHITKTLLNTDSTIDINTPTANNYHITRGTKSTKQDKQKRKKDHQRMKTGNRR